MVVGVDTGQGPPRLSAPRGSGLPVQRGRGCVPPGGRLSGLSCLWPQSSPFRLWEESPCGPARALLWC